MTDEHGDHPHVNYAMIFGFLCVFTALSVIADVLEIPNRKLLIFIVLLIACFKASYVLRYFMHLKFEGKWKYVILLPTTVLALALPFTLAPDIGVHYYDIDVPQQNSLLEKERQAEEHKAEDDNEHHGDDAAEHGGEH